MSEKKRYLQVVRYSGEQILGGWTDEIARTLLTLVDEIKDAGDTSDRWHLRVIEMTQEEYNKMPEFQGY